MSNEKSGRVAPFEYQLALWQEEVKEQAQGHVTLLGPAAACLPGSRSRWPNARRSGALGGPAGCGGVLAEELPDRVRPGLAAQHEPDLGAR